MDKKNIFAENKAYKLSTKHSQNLFTTTGVKAVKKILNEIPIEKNIFGKFIKNIC